MTTASAPKARTQLERSLKPQWVWAIALGSAIGWGAFVLPTDWLTTAGPVGTVIGLLVGAALMCLIAVSYGFLIRTFPVSGGEYAYAYTAFGRLHAYVCGWFLTLGYISIVALNASALALLFRRMLPWTVEWAPLWEIAGWQVYFGEVLVASLALVIFAVFNVRGTTLSGRMQYVFCLIMLAAVVLMLAGTLLHPGTPWSNLRPGFPEGVAPLSATLAIVAIAPWAYVGFDSVPQAAEEFDFPPQKAFGLIVMAIVVAAAIYVAMVLASGAAIPWTELAADKPVWGTADGMSAMFGTLGLVALAVGVSMGVFTGLNGFYISASRLLFAMGRAHAIPTAFARLHPRSGTPALAIWFVTGVCLIAPWFGREALVWVVDMSSVGVTIAYTYTCLAAFSLFTWSGAPVPAGAPEGASSTTKKVLSALGAVTGVGFFLLLMTPGSPAQLGKEPLLALAVWTVLGVAFYLTHRARQERTLTDEEMDHMVLGEQYRPTPTSS